MQAMARQAQRVLYIEDNPANLKLVVHILGRRPHIHLLTAHTPELGIELALAHKPELILLDINMPGSDGYRILEIFKTDARLKTVPVIAVTANAMPRDIERGMQAGFAAYLTKPLDVEQFLNVVDSRLPERPEYALQEK
jgi:CheY-like chemotaxis protein